jgi:isopentenyl-diphosphate delta-isomerase
MGSHDAEQLRLLGEQCILIDTDDRPLGPISKEKSHKTVNIRDGMLHRAFSVFLFNSKGELLLQQRAKAKITFPAFWTNTCCSHPLYVKEELEEKDHLGVKLAAQRKLEHELGIPKGTIGVDELFFLTKLHYQALQDEEWGEHEIDHILIAQKDVKLNPNDGEVMATQYVTPQQLKDLFAQRNTQLKSKELKEKEEKLYITPWFEIICNEFLFKWWDDLSNIIQQKGLKDRSDVIHRLSLPDQNEKAVSSTSSETVQGPSTNTEIVEGGSAVSPKKRKLETE